jgi:leucyl-tRNA synthetase
MWQEFPQADPRWLQQEMIEVPVQVNGKVRSKIEVAVDISEEQIKEQVLADSRVQEYTDGKEIVKFVWVPGRMVNFVVR